MSGLLFLTSDDFQITKGTKGNILSTNLKGFSLILFYSTQCEHCQSLIPIFKSLPGTIGGCQFGMINISQNKQAILLSRETIAPIKVVPYIILYIHGKPYMRYQGPHDSNEITRFVVEVAKKLQERPNYVNNTSKKHDHKMKSSNDNDIPAYTIGKPLCGEEDNVCYLEFNNAYGSVEIVK